MPHLLVFDARYDLLSIWMIAYRAKNPLGRSALIAYIRHPEVALDLDGPVKAYHLPYFPPAS